MRFSDLVCFMIEKKSDENTMAAFIVFVVATM